MIQSVAIVGGGTAGWMTATYLKRAMPRLSVTVLESPTIKTIGVGEASFSTLKIFFDFLGIQEHEWMPPCNATYKLGIRYVNWAPTPFYHPFQRYDVVSGYDSAEWWLKIRPGRRFDQSCFTTPALCDAYRSPRYLDHSVFDEKVTRHFRVDAVSSNNLLGDHTVQYPYGYQFDASLLAALLKQYALAWGVRHIADDLREVEIAEDGSVACLMASRTGRIYADLYVDCTGFRSLLLSRALREPFISFSESLPNDRAVAIQVPSNPEESDIPPYTTSTALTAGWAWRIPLFSRDGCGYVYSSAFLTEEQAEAELRSLVGPRSVDCSANHISMRVGRPRNSWVKNCVAIGLASGFVEPLESTTIFFIQHGVEELVKYLSASSASDEGWNLRGYNKTIRECIEGVREFLVLHYYASKRDDSPYWQAMKNLRLSDELRERIERFNSRLPDRQTIYQPFHGFESYSWSVIWLGMNNVPEKHLRALDQLDSRVAEAMFGAIQERSAALVKTLPSHYEYLMRQRLLSQSAQQG